MVPGAGSVDSPGPRWVLGAFGDGFGTGPTASTSACSTPRRRSGPCCSAAPATSACDRSRPSPALLIAIFTVAGPLLSLDVFSYIAYARLGVEHGLDPYEFGPAAIPLDEAAARVDDYRDAVSVYGPLFTLGSYPLGALGVPAALWSLKAIAGLAIAAIAALVARLARLRGVDPATAVAFVALNPLVLVHLVGGAHNDGLMVAVAMAAIAAALTSRPALAGAGFVAAAAIKVSAVLYAPFALVGSRDRGRLVAGALAALALFAVGLAARVRAARERGVQRRRRQPGPDQPLERPGHAGADHRRRRRSLPRPGGRRLRGRGGGPARRRRAAASTGSGRPDGRASAC